MNKYILKDGTEVEAIPIGKAKITIGDLSRFGYLTIVDRAPNAPNSRKARVICKCKCGNYTILNAQEFYQGTTRSCGCYATQLHKELGQKLGKMKKSPKDYTQVINPYYTFIKRLDRTDESGTFYWLISCNNCGKEFEAIPAFLVSDHRRKGNNPCDCWKRKSKGVLKIKKILETNHIDFIEEYTFSDCLSPKGNYLKFDFYLPNHNLLIEYDGEQHFVPSSFGATDVSGEEKLKLTQLYDNIKNEYCKTNNIPLKRIPYTDYNILSLEKILD